MRPAFFGKAAGGCLATNCRIASSSTSVISTPWAAQAVLKARCSSGGMIRLIRLYPSFIDDDVFAMGLTSFLLCYVEGGGPLKIVIYTYISNRRCLCKIIIRPQFQQDFNLTTDQTGVFNSSLERDIAVPINATIEELDNVPLSEVQGFKEPALPWYSDQILPFDITIAAANEYGAAASAKLFGVEILNEGFGSSVDDSVLEQQATFVARSVAPLQAVGRTNLLKS